MNLYRIEYDGQPYYVEAPSFQAAIGAWTEHVKGAWGPEYEGTEQPESVACIHDQPVIR